MQGCIKNIADLVEPLSAAIKEECPQIDLFVGAITKHEEKKVFQMVQPLAEIFGKDVGEVCCFSFHNLRPDLGSERWRVLTTHGNTEVKLSGENFEVSICQNHLPPSENASSRQLVEMRDNLMCRLNGLSGSVPYSEIKGNVLLCGDFSLWPCASLLSLRKIFLANGAKNVFFATLAISRKKCNILKKQDCKIIRLHPSEIKRRVAV